MNTKNIGKITLFGFIGGIAAIGAMKLVETPQIKEKVIIQQPHHFSQVNNGVSTLLNNSSALPENGFVDISKNTIHTVVHVKTQFTPNYQIDPMMEFFWGGKIKAKPQVATGSGVIISDDGYIVTNNHVIDNADQIEITLNNKKTYTADVIGTDPSTDLALIKIDEKNLPFITFANSDALHIGEWVLAVGNPFNLTSTVTAGIVSAKSRSINILKSDPNNNVFPLEAFIQTDAAVNPGNSGGALVDTKGNLVGINTAIASQTGSYTGYSFAVPSNIVNKVTKDLLEYGEVQRAFIGVIIENVDQAKANELGLTEIEGIYVRDLSENGSAKKAGIEPGDVIIEIENDKVNTTPELQEKVAQYRPGDKINISLLRDGDKLDKVLTLTDKNGEYNFTIEKNKPNETSKVLGATFSEIPKDLKKNLKIESGAMVSNLADGVLKNRGIKIGFIITKINKIPISSATHVKRILSETKGGILIEGYYKNGTTAYYGFGL